MWQVEDAVKASIRYIVMPLRSRLRTLFPFTVTSMKNHMSTPAK